MDLEIEALVWYDEGKPCHNLMTLYLIPALTSKAGVPVQPQPRP